MSTADLNNLVVAALKRAMRAKGIEGNASAFTRLLRQEAGDGPDASTVGRWLKAEQIVPAWALIAASRASGLAPTDLLLPEADVADLRRLVDDLREEVAELRSVATATSSIDPDEIDLDGIGRVLAAVGDGLAEAGRELHLAWEDDRTQDTAAGAERDRVRRLQRRAGLLQARMMEVQSTLGLQRSVPPPDPSHSAASQLSQAAGVLAQQMDGVRDRLVEHRRNQVSGRRKRAVD